MTRLQWLHERGTELLYFRSRSFLPRLAITALVLAFVSPFSTLAILLMLNGKETWPQDGIYRVLQPASCLSLLLSFTSATITFALSEGAVITWWRQYQKGADINTLQKIWSIQDWLLDALGSAFNPHDRHYLTIPRIYLLVLPLNGFILQGAILTEANYVSNPANIEVPIVSSLDFGFTRGGPNDNTWSKYWGQNWQQAMDVAGTSISQYVYFGSRDWNSNATIDFGYDQHSEYTATVPGAGFDINCSHSGMDYDMQPTAERPNTSGYIFNSSFQWDPSRPNEIKLEVLWKESDSCVGQYNITRCILRAATVEYPIRVSMNVSNNPYRGPFYRLQHLDYGRLDKSIEILPVDPREGQNGLWTYAGIRNTLAADYESSFEVYDFFNDTNSNKRDFNITGSFARALQPDGPSDAYNCNWSYTKGIAHVDKYRHLDSDTIDERIERGGDPEEHLEKASPAYMIIDRLRNAMFLNAVYIGSGPVQSGRANLTNETYPLDHFIQTVPAIQTRIVTQYKTHLDVWFASLAITWSSIFIVLPTFWSFWTLPHKKDLSPVEIARAFNAPVFQHIDAEEETSEVLSQVGHERGRTAGARLDETLRLKPADEP